MKIKFYNIDEEFDPSRVVTNAEIMDKTRAFTDDGLYSERLFGTISGEEIEYSCNCKALHGKMFEGLTCQDCGSVVSKKQSVISRMAWIDLGEYRIINPRFLPFLYKYFGASKLSRYLFSSYPIDKDGLPKAESGEEETTKKRGDKKQKDPMAECIGLGVKRFIENFDAIIQVYHDTVKKGADENYYDFLMKYRDMLFISKIPVFSPKLRPIIVQGDKVITDPMNEKYTQLIKLVAGLRSLKYDNKEISVYAFINKIQVIAEDIDKNVILALNGKKGLIRNTVLGSRLNFSARCVLTPLHWGTEIDELHLPYVVCLELFKLDIFNYLHTVKGMSYFKAEVVFTKAVTEFNQELYDFLMDKIRKEDGIPMLVNRNPTIAIGSIMMLRLTHVKSDIKDLTMSMRCNLLPSFAADFDGDVINNHRVTITSHRQAFEKISPKNLIFSFNDGKFNRNFDFTKDYTLGLQTLLSD
mgnify:FL=1